jgi:hypothetical protein
MSSFTQEPNAGLSQADYERKLLARDKTIDVLKRRIAQEARHSHTTPFAILEQNIGLEKVVARKTMELENERRELKKHYRITVSAGPTVASAENGVYWSACRRYCA